MKETITLSMRLIERADPLNRSIKKILIETRESSQNIEDAANKIGITRQTFSNWWHRLGCHNEMPLQTEVA